MTAPAKPSRSEQEVERDRLRSLAFWCRFVGYDSDLRPDAIPRGHAPSDKPAYATWHPPA